MKHTLFSAPDYKAELEKAARQMILIHDTGLLNKIILRTIVRNIKVRHAGIFLYDRDKKEYVITVSWGEKGLKVPAGFAKIDTTNPIIRYFLEKDKRIDSGKFLILEKLKFFLKKGLPLKNNKLRDFYESLILNLSFFQASACVAGFFRDDLVGILFLGRKPASNRFTNSELGFLSVLASDVVMAIKNAALFEDLKKQADKTRSLFLNTVQALAQAIETKDNYTFGHTERVTSYSLVILNEMRNLIKMASEQVNNLRENLRIAALLHDIGKIGVSEKILNKKGQLSLKERESIQAHSLMGVRILEPIAEFKDILSGVRYHHERHDGRGYPEGLKGKKIPLIAAILAVADSYDAMTSDRPYRRALSKEDAKKEIISQRGKQFNPAAVKAFVSAYKKGLL